MSPVVVALGELSSPGARGGGAGVADAFERAWSAVAAHVARYAHRVSRHRADADDLYQRVAIRAWRGHDGFRGESGYLAWVMAIAARESTRLGSSRARLERREPSPDDVPHEVRRREALDAADEVVPPTDAGWLGAVTEQARRHNVLAGLEHSVVIARLRHPDHPWQRIGDDVSATANACAVAHFRAVLKLRVFLFEHRLDLLGGRGLVSSAYERALTGDDPLTPAEADAFRAVVLDESGSRRRGWQTALRGACAKVIRHLDPP
ncbi:MAG: hypothetical protein GEV10_25175 [Streptosporangiales bacterium]|nr:hypothetical protein [Streptosporangiales bacterium]